MKTPVVLVAVSLAMAILLSASLLIATGARGENALRGVNAQPQSWVLPGPPPAESPGFDLIDRKAWKAAPSA